MRSMFGWSYPPGAANDPNAPWNQEPGPCAVCARHEDQCVCPQCKVCGSQGDANCYYDSRQEGKRPTGAYGHGLYLTREQLVGRAEAEIQQRQQSLDDAKHYLEYLKEGCDFDSDLAVNPDPWR